MKKLKLCAFMLLAVLAMLVLTACNRNGGEAGYEEGVDFRADVPASLRMSWWGGDERHDAIIAAVRHFESENPHITVDATGLGWDGYHTSMTVQLMAGDAPDLFSFGAGYRVTYNAFLRDFAEYMHLFPFLEERRDILETHVYMVGGRIVGVPAGIGAHVMAFSKTLFDRAGVPHPTDDMTQSDWNDMTEAVIAALGPGYFADSGWYWGPAWSSLGEPSWGMPSSWIDFTDFETQPPRINVDWDVHRRIWSTVERHWDLGVIPRAGDDDVGFPTGNALFASTASPRGVSAGTEMEIGLVLGPRRWDENSPIVRMAPSPGLFWGVPESTNNPLQAIFLLEFLQTDPTAVEHIGFHVGSPTNTASLLHLQSTLEEGSYEYHQLRIFNMSMEGVDEWVAHPAVAGQPEASAAWRQTLYEFLHEVIDLETFLVRVIDEVQNAFDTFFIPLTD